MSQSQAAPTHTHTPTPSALETAGCCNPDLDGSPVSRYLFVAFYPLLEVPEPWKETREAPMTQVGGGRRGNVPGTKNLQHPVLRSTGTRQTPKPP